MVNFVGDTRLKTPSSGILQKTLSGGVMGGGNNFLPPTFYADYTTGVLDAIRSFGSPTATFTASRGASNPATYIDSDGVMQKTETSNVGRFTKYSYDSTGLISTPGLYVEGAATNYLLRSMEFDHVAWVKSNATVVANNTTAPDGTETADKITFDANSSALVRQAVSGENPASSTYTFSVWLRSDSARDVRLRIDSTTSGSLSTVSLATTWRRVSVTRTFAVTDIADVEANIFNSDPNSVVPIYAWGAQLEKNSYATSFIPTTTAALTRNAEVLKYATLGNRTASVESMIVKLYPGFANDIFSNYPTITDTDTKRRYALFNQGTNDVVIKPNTTDSTSSSVTNLINDTWSALDSMTLGYNFQHSSPYVEGFYQGVTDGTPDTSDDFTDPVWGTYFYVGSDTGGTNQLNGIISQIAFFDRVLTDAEHLQGYNSEGIKVLK